MSGVARQTPPGGRPSRRIARPALRSSGRSLATVREGGSREMAVTVFGRHQNPAYGDQTHSVRAQQAPRRMCLVISESELRLGDWPATRSSKPSSEEH